MVNLQWENKVEVVARTQSLLLKPAHGFKDYHTHFPQRPDSDKNALIVSDSLTALLELLPIYAHQNQTVGFNFVYIDPPYNSGRQLSYSSSGQVFGVGSSFSSISKTDAWLNMLYPRIFFARMLMASDGVFFASIDDHEQAHLFLLLEEIFGRDNYLGTLKWKKKRKPSFLKKNLCSVIEYVHVFAKDIKKAPRLGGSATCEVTRPVMNQGNKIVCRTLPAGMLALCPDGVYKAGDYVNRTLSFQILGDAHIVQGRLLHPITAVGPFRVSQQEIETQGFITKRFGLRRYVRPEEHTQKIATDDFTNIATNEDGEQELKQIFGKRVFAFPKPLGLLHELLSMFPKPLSQPFRCLDFFAGSGTLAHAVLAANAVDGQQRVVTCIQSQEPLRIRVPSEFKFVSDLTQERIKYALATTNCQTSFQVFSTVAESVSM